MDFELLQDLIKAFSLHQQSIAAGEKVTISQFAIWLNEQQYTTNQPLHSELTDIIGRNELDTEIGKLVIYLNRYARLLIKKGLSGLEDFVNDDFTYLYILMTAESMTKIQLIEKNVHEKPTGLEIIKRLLKKGLIGERPDQMDKRSKRVFVTEKGKALFFRSLQQMGMVSELITGNLTEDEKKQLFTLLRKLERFHSPIFLEDNLASLEQLLKKHKGEK